MKKIAFVVAATATLLALTACDRGGGKDTVPKSDTPTKVDLTDKEKAEINALPVDKLVHAVRTYGGAKFAYADLRLAAILKTTTDEKLVASVTETRLPFGEAMYEANMAMLRLKKKP
jgi:hypothetical protein